MNPSAGDLYDVQEIRRRSRQSIDEGPVTGSYSLDRGQACRLLNEALASEILCVLRYRHHEVIAKGIDSPQVSQVFAEHALEEQNHMIEIAERIDQLGGDPDFNPATIASRSATEYGQGEQLHDLIRDDLVSERIVIDVYRKLVEWFGNQDSTSRRMLEEILEDEEEHANELADLLASMEARPSESGAVRREEVMTSLPETQGGR